MAPRRVFIFGCHRSGTTMMRLILNSHKSIHCFDEWKSYTCVQEDKYENEKNAPVVGLKMPNWTEYIVESERHSKHYRGDPIIFMFRDVRACIASMLTLATGNGCFFNGVQEAIDIKWKDDPYRKFWPAHEVELNKIEQMSEPKHRKAALYWRYKTSRYLEMVRKGYCVFPIHYDLFVLNPKSHLTLLMDFLGLEWDDHLLQHHLREHDEVYNGLAVGNTLVNRSIDANSVDKWKEVLTSEQENAILETARVWNNYASIHGLEAHMSI